VTINAMPKEFNIGNHYDAMVAKEWTCWYHWENSLQNLTHIKAPFIAKFYFFVKEYKNSKIVGKIKY
jgi:hypothetical protein